MTVDGDGITARSTPAKYLEGQAARFSAWVTSLSEGSARDRGTLILSTLDDGLRVDPPTIPLSRTVSVERLVAGTVLSTAFVWPQYGGSTAGLVVLALPAFATVTALYSTTIGREHVEAVDPEDWTLRIAHETTPGIRYFLGHDETESTWRLPDAASPEEARRAFAGYDVTVGPDEKDDLAGIDRE